MRCDGKMAASRAFLAWCSCSAVYVRCDGEMAASCAFLAWCSCSVFAYNASTGLHLWTFATSNSVYGIAIGASGDVLVTSDDNVYSLKG